MNNIIGNLSNNIAWMLKQDSDRQACHDSKSLKCGGVTLTVNGYVILYIYINNTCNTAMHQNNNITCNRHKSKLSKLPKYTYMSLLSLSQKKLCFILFFNFITFYLFYSVRKIAKISVSVYLSKKVYVSV